jgi:hypothetical protein
MASISKVTAMKCQLFLAKKVFFYFAFFAQGNFLAPQQKNSRDVIQARKLQQ